MDVSPIAKRFVSPSSGVTSAGSRSPTTYAPRTERTVWWKEWEANDSWRDRRYDQNLSPADRLRDAALDFKLDRFWPRQVALGPYGLFHLWDQFRIFIGLSYRPIINFNRHDPAEGSDSGSDDDADTKGIYKRKPAPVRVFERPRLLPGQTGEKAQPLRQKYHRVFCGIGAAYHYDYDATIEKDLNPGQIYLRHIEEKDDRMDKFLYDPETSMKILFSSYFWEHTLNLSEECRSNFAIVASCFLNYVIQCKALGEPEYEIPLQKALTVTEMARKQLPLTSALAYAFPDDVSKAFSSTFPRKKDVGSTLSDIPPTFREILLQEEANIIDVETIVENDWDVQEDTASAADRWFVACPSLELWLGSATARFKANHMAGIVEVSSRRIARVQPAKVSLTEAVERTLENTFATVDLAPLEVWGHAASSDIQPPVILSTNRSLVTHDPSQDTITLLVKPESTHLFTAAVGMILQATWVQIARQDSVDNGVGKYWYMEHLSNQFPSFYTEDLLEM
ncbi:hypothetical protein OF83DRAFT_1090518 [Amylostereum chailletii]|nr:hypothetical protein OF83DRAFT_1090518 [Amylostereum chailletii]